MKKLAKEEESRSPWAPSGLHEDEAKEDEKKEESGDDEDEDKEDEDEAKEDEKKEEKKDKADEKGTWSKFWKEFNKNLKMGCYEDDSNRSKLSKLLRFASTKSEGKEISLDKYLDRMQ